MLHIRKDLEQCANKLQPIGKKTNNSKGNICVNCNTILYSEWPRDNCTNCGSEDHIVEFIPCDICGRQIGFHNFQCDELDTLICPDCVEQYIDNAVTATFLTNDIKQVRAEIFDIEQEYTPADIVGDSDKLHKYNYKRERKLTSLNNKLKFLQDQISRLTS